MQLLEPLCGDRLVKMSTIVSLATAWLDLLVVVSRRPDSLVSGRCRKIWHWHGSDCDRNGCATLVRVRQAMWTEGLRVDARVPVRLSSPATGGGEECVTVQVSRDGRSVFLQLGCPAADSLRSRVVSTLSAIERAHGQGALVDGRVALECGVGGRDDVFIVIRASEASIHDWLFGVHPSLAAQGAYVPGPVKGVTWETATCSLIHAALWFPDKHAVTRNARTRLRLLRCVDHVARSPATRLGVPPPASARRCARLADGLAARLRRQCDKAVSDQTRGDPLCARSRLLAGRLMRDSPQLRVDESMEFFRCSVPVPVTPRNDSQDPLYDIAVACVLCKCHRGESLSAMRFLSPPPYFRAYRRLDTDIDGRIARLFPPMSRHHTSRETAARAAATVICRAARRWLERRRVATQLCESLCLRGDLPDSRLVSRWMDMHVEALACGYEASLRVDFTDIADEDPLLPRTSAHMQYCRPKARAVAALRSVLSQPREWTMLVRTRYEVSNSGVRERVVAWLAAQGLVVGPFKLVCAGREDGRWQNAEWCFVPETYAVVRRSGYVTAQGGRRSKDVTEGLVRSAFELLWPGNLTAACAVSLTTCACERYRDAAVRILEGARAVDLSRGGVLAACAALVTGDATIDVRSTRCLAGLIAKVAHECTLGSAECFAAVESICLSGCADDCPAEWQPEAVQIRSQVLSCRRSLCELFALNHTGSDRPACFRDKVAYRSLYVALDAVCESYLVHVRAHAAEFPWRGTEPSRWAWMHRLATLILPVCQLRAYLHPKSRQRAAVQDALRTVESKLHREHACFAKSTACDQVLARALGFLRYAIERTGERSNR